MKYIFRYTLLSQFTEKETLITKQQLMEALKTTNSLISIGDVDRIIQKYTQLIRVLTKANDRREHQEIFKEALEKEGLSQGEVAEVVAVWQTEKHLVYKKVLSQNSKSTPSFQGLHWSLRRGVAAKNGVSAELQTVSLELRDQQQGFRLCLPAEQLCRLSSSVGSGTAFLSELFESQ